MEYQIILMTIIALSAVISILGVIFNWLLNPVKENQARIATELKENQARMDKKFEENLIRMDAKFEENQARMEAKFEELKKVVLKLA